MKNKEQKIIGLLLIVVNLIGVAVLKDATAAVLLVPFGIYVMLTKEDLLIHTGGESDSDV